MVDGWLRVYRLAGMLFVAGLFFVSLAHAAGADEAADAALDEEEEEEESPGRSFFYKELVLSGFYSAHGVVGIPPGNNDRHHWDLSYRPPGNYAGVDYVQTFTRRFFLNRRLLPEWLPLTAVDLHPRAVFERMESRGGIHRVRFAPQDFWLRFNPGRRDRLTLRVGQFVIPYGVNPIMAPRQRFLLPLEATDLGLKWDWGLNLKGPLGEYDWEIAATIGSGEGLHSPSLTSDSKRSYLLTGRLGTPTYWDLQYGLSFLLGDLPMVRAAKVFDPHSISRWRTGLDAIYKYGTYLMIGAQAAYGQDGYAGDERFVMISGGETADVFGGIAWADWVVPRVQDLRLALQFESVIRDLSTSDSDDTAAVVEIGYSILTSVTLMLDYRADVNRTMGEADHAIFLTFIYYGS
ncbi:MAG: hypothetical protein A3J75_00850 [Acidobacteria bacterium RBG_16_68_9]|nr:MAG: hypothetical protein A3J75_00850 [Acidobacteria bacterium RBG_16_68_9]